MKILTTLALSISLGTASFAAQAAGQSEQDLQQCMVELRGIYGEETDLRLVDRRRNEHGTRMRVAAKLDADNSYFASCWVAHYDQGELDYDHDSGALAVTDLVVIQR